MDFKEEHSQCDVMLIDAIDDLWLCTRHLQLKGDCNHPCATAIQVLKRKRSCDNEVYLLSEDEEDFVSQIRSSIIMGFQTESNQREETLTSNGTLESVEASSDEPTENIKKRIKTELEKTGLVSFKNTDLQQTSHSEKNSIF